ncbi:uncharacterized protein Fot_15177 [Forsythia ovata]|uniref:Uncharacterized protein n=1 Tax=Forsythia ovata TaxID=205694 RepID=A0ABD1W8H6_9LAMI
MVEETKRNENSWMNTEEQSSRMVEIDKNVTLMSESMVIMDGIEASHPQSKNLNTISDGKLGLPERFRFLVAEKPLTAAGSNEDSEIEDKQEHQHMNSRNHSKYFQEPQMNCLERESRLYGELEAIYKRIGTAGSNQTGSGSVRLPLNTHIPASEASIGEEESMKMAKKRRKRKKMKDQLDSMANFLESLVKHIMEHQENLHQKFTEVIERSDQERREREEAWKKQELAKFEREAEARAREKAMATSREAAIVSYLEKITGQRINLPPLKLQPVISENPEVAWELIAEHCRELVAEMARQSIDCRAISAISLKNFFARQSV